MNRAVLITGASSGIGAQLKKHFDECGDKVINLSLNNPENPCDITKTEQLDKFFDGIKDEKLDILINCAGQGLSGAVELVEEELIRKQFDINFFGLVNVTKHALPLMKEKSKIINISSTCALFPLPFRAYYCASKAAVSMITDGLRMELKNTGIQVAAICPGEVKTNFTKNRVKEFKTNERYGDSVKNSTLYVDSHEDKRMSVEYAVKKMVKFIEKKKLKPQVIIGKQKVLYFLKRLVPKSWFIGVTQKMFVKN